MAKILALLEAMEAFRTIGWLPYIEKLHGYNQAIIEKFSHTCNEEDAMVKGLRVSISEEMVVEVTGLPRLGERCFKMGIATNKRAFLLPDEKLQESSQGINQISLLEHWVEVATHLIIYITCEGRINYIFTHHLWLLAHMHHGKLVDLTYFLSKPLSRMATQFQKKWS